MEVSDTISSMVLRICNLPYILIGILIFETLCIQIEVRYIPQHFATVYQDQRIIRSCHLVDKHQSHYRTYSNADGYTQKHQNNHYG